MTRSIRLLRILAAAAAVALVMFAWSQNSPPPAGAVFDDSDGDGAIDLAEETTGSDPSDPRSTPETTGTEIVAGYAACSDGFDNDADGLTDDGDPGCTDSDGDLVADPGEILYGSDPNNASSFPEDSRLDAILEYYGFPIFFCGDGADNDGDGLTDADDPGCTPIRGDSDAFDDATEKRFGSDPANASSVPEHEIPNPGSCSDGIDNDLDGLTDAADPACAAPANDDRASATVITILPYTDGPNIMKNATAESDEPRPSCSFGSLPASVWYRYDATQDGVLIADTAGTNFDTVLAVWQETGASLTAVDCDNGYDGTENQSRVAFRISAGQTYLFQVGGFPFYTRTQPSLAFHLESGTPPANDSFATLADIAALPYTDAADTSAATTQFGEPDPTCSYDVQSTVWYRYTAAQDELLVADTSGSDYDPIIGVWTDSKFGLTSVTCATTQYFGPGPGPVPTEVPARLAFQAEAGRTYYFQLGGPSYGRSFGALSFHLEAGIPPANDDFASATVVTSLPFTDTVDMLTATSEAGEPLPSCAYSSSVAQSIWYRYTATSNGYVEADTGDAFRYDLIVAAYEGTSLGDLTEVACAQPYPPANFAAFPVVASRTYYVLVASRGYYGGKFFVSGDAAPLPPVPPPPPGTLVTFHMDALAVPDCAPSTFSFSDPTGDQFGGFGPLPPGASPPDITSVTGGDDGQNVCLNVQFAGPLPPPDPFRGSSTIVVNFDADQAPGQTMTCLEGYGSDLSVYVPVPSNVIIPLYSYLPVPYPPEGFIAYAILNESSLRLIVPLAALGGDNSFRVTVLVNSPDGLDCAPNDGAVQSPVPPAPGDPNCDGQTNSLDSLLILQLTADLIDSLPCVYVADVDSSGNVSPIDATLILQAESGMLTAFPGG